MGGCQIPSLDTGGERSLTTPAVPKRSDFDFKTEFVILFYIYTAPCSLFEASH